MAVPVISVAEMRQWEQSSWDEGRSQPEVIENAGEIVADHALRMTRDEDRILVLAGKGHNGDDARCAQGHLVGRRVKLLDVDDPAQHMHELESLLEKEPSLIIDGLFGIGLNRALSDDWVNFIELVNSTHIPVLAVDVPSGLSAETGEPQPISVVATETLTFGAPKQGLIVSTSYPFVGKLTVAPDIGLVPCPFTGELQWTLHEDFLGIPPARRIDGHKGTFGHVAIVAGSQGFHGASVLATRGALRARPGLVSGYCDPAVYLPVACQSQAAMIHSFRPELRLPESCTSIVIGPGLASQELGDEWKRWVNEQWQNFNMPVIVDASALDWIEPGPTALNSRRVITPHPGEAARLLGTKPASVQEDRLGSLRALSGKFGNCWVVLKGHQTMIGRSTGEVFINCTGDPYLAQGGSGDVLAGFMGGLLAQAKMQAHPLKTIRYAVWAHGLAAETLTKRGRVWTVDDLLRTIGDVNLD